MEQRLAWVTRSRKSRGELAPFERLYRADVGYGWSGVFMGRRVNGERICVLR